MSVALVFEVLDALEEFVVVLLDELGALDFIEDELFEAEVAMAFGAVVAAAAGEAFEPWLEQYPATFVPSALV